MLIPVSCLGSVLVLFIAIPSLSILWHQRQNDYEYSYIIKITALMISVNEIIMLMKK